MTGLVMVSTLMITHDNCDARSSCYDDVAYTEAVLYDVTSRLCVDTDQVHVSGAMRLDSLTL